MKKTLLKTIILISVLAVPALSSANGRMDVGLVIPVPPPVVYHGPLSVVVLPGTYVYAVPDSDVDIFFYAGWWWRPWQGRWYRSHDHRSGWRYYSGTPSFHRHVPANWRNDYRHNRWKGQRWNHHRISLSRVQKDWHRWERDRHWERKGNWGVHGTRYESQKRHRSVRVQKPYQKPQVRVQKPQKHYKRGPEYYVKEKKVTVRSHQQYDAGRKNYRDKKAYKYSQQKHDQSRDRGSQNRYPQKRHSRPLERHYDKKIR